MTTVRTPQFDVRAPEVLDDPVPAYARLRAAGAVLPNGPGQWVVPRYREVAELLKDQRLTKTLPEAYYRYTVGDPELSGFLSGQNLGRRNALAAKVLAGAFSPALVRRLDATMRQQVDDLLAPALAGGELDLVADVALPFPLAVICELLGVPPAERAELWPYAAQLVRAFSDIAFLSDQDVGEAVAALRWLRGYLTDLLRRGTGGDDLLTRMAATEAGGERLTPQEIVDNAITVFYAGFETSMGMISNGMVALLRNPDQLARLRERPDLTAPAVEEMLRYEAPIQVTMRSPLEPIQVGGRNIRPGRVLYLLVGSANRDPEQFTDPDRFDIGRTPNPHLSFGAGVYRCVGAALARAEGVAVFDRLLATTRDIGFAGEPVRRPRFNFRTYDRVPLHVRPA
ncbi:cytochrome P450 [Micromonospora sp. R77]|uniref:cytochrome P450 n=1 Tax=Micromonospora sp. R77 TaxID=2925836 RepID=UPI001F60F078|nr:cytochrome P450 [Micromonospora sp. R77]MCI4066444.1 cytochrome P450 [Micromonospora sp. R77]